MLPIFSGGNHYAVAIDFILSLLAVFLLIVSIVLKSKIFISINLASLMISIGLNIFNIGVEYHKWIEREQPDPYTYSESIKHHD